MFNFIGLLNIISLTACGLAILFLATGWHKALRRDTNYLLLGLLLCLLLYHAYLALEWFGIDTSMQSTEDIIGALVAVLWVVSFHGLFNNVVDQQRLRAEESLRKNEKFLNAIIENIPDMIFVKDAQDLKFVRFNAAGENLLGYSREEMLGKSDSDFFTKEEADAFNERDRAVLFLGSKESIIHEQISTRYKGTRILNTQKIAMLDDEGNPEYLLGISEDITDEIRSQKELEHWGSIFENAGWGVAVVNADNWILELSNPAFAKMHGYETLDLKASPLTRLVAPRLWNQFQQQILDAKYQDGFSFETSLVKKDGSEFPAKIDATYVNNNGDRQHYWVVNIQDITAVKAAEKKRLQLENQLRQAQKMESIGTLAGGIAHDFNNILGVILGFSEVTLASLNEKDQNFEAMQNIQDAANRAKDLVRQILTFSRQAEAKIGPVRIEPLVSEAARFLRSSIPKHIDIQQEIDQIQETVMADPVQIQQVIINLCTNAAHAMRDKGGLLEIRLQAINSQTEVANAPLKEGRYAKLTVSDDGKGMDEATLERIFEPYFTTKSQDEGTGLGLAVVHGIIKSHGGEISVYSSEGEGTTFRVYLPLSEQYVQPSKATILSASEGTETIMVIDDEHSLMEAERQLLEILGYRVDGFTNPMEALERLRTAPEIYDLIITDQSMPEMTGADLASQARSIRPDLPVILCTGYSAPFGKDELLQMGVSRYLTKPMTLEDVAEAVRDVLNQAAKLKQVQ